MPSRGKRSIYKSIHATNVHVSVSFLILLHPQNAIFPLLATTHSSRTSSNISSGMPSSVLLVQYMRVFIACINCTVYVSITRQWASHGIKTSFPFKVPDNAYRCFWNKATFPKDFLRFFQTSVGIKIAQGPYKSANLSPTQYSNSASQGEGKVEQGSYFKWLCLRIRTLYGPSLIKLHSFSCLLLGLWFGSWDLY